MLTSGHRERIKERFLKTDGKDLLDYELLELLLTYAIPRIDVKPLAKTLLINFGSLGNVLSAPVDELVKIKGIKEHTAILIKLVASMEQSLLKTEMKTKSHLNSWEAVENYCYALLGRETKEFRPELDGKYKPVYSEPDVLGRREIIGYVPRNIFDVWN